MHIISNERGLEHWHALLGIPPLAMACLRNRLLRDQPRLVAVLLSLSNAAKAGPDGKFVLQKEGSPKLKSFAQRLETAAMVAEVIQREAGHPLRSLTKEEVGELMNASTTRFCDFRDSMSAADRPAERLFESSSQPHLTTGVWTALCSDDRIDRERVLLECFLLRMMIDGLHLACEGEHPPDAVRTELTGEDGGPIKVEISAALDKIYGPVDQPAKVLEAEVVE